MNFTEQFLAETTQIVQQLDTNAIDRVIALLVETRACGGRLFILGVGGSAANASHAVNDFRKIVGLEAYAPTDNVAELTARTNDDGWASIFARGYRRADSEQMIWSVFSRWEEAISIKTSAPTLWPHCNMRSRSVRGL